MALGVSDHSNQSILDILTPTPVSSPKLLSPCKQQEEEGNDDGIYKALGKHIGREVKIFHILMLFSVLGQTV